MAVAALVFAAGAPADADSFPSRSIRVIVPASVSTPPDIITRIVANALSESEGWNVVVEDRPGAVQTLGAHEVLKQPADGYTILSVGVPLSAAQTLVPDIGFQLDSDFAPIVQLSESGNVLVVNPSVPVKSVAELVQYLKQNPDKLTYSSGGFGTPAHLIGELFKLQTGVRVTHVPYNDFPRAITDLLQGVNAYQFITVLPVLGFIKSGQLRALAVTPPKRVPQLPDVPTLAEAGYPALTNFDWVGWSARAGTPPEVIGRVNAAVNKVLKMPKVIDAFDKVGSQTVGGPPGQLGELVKSQVALWAKVVADAGLKLQQ
ncbi:MAG TPA: tripartite tricarboxylate transporter substrate-binding protein [Acetobacteraceae bacterium]|jgi:tripartite-type tricarboxylate transporter receptor subunit TctC|nr:tripartite tricarboxylate transporter substrate-binding protein [Acetobacteraceae bacterium]